MQSPLRLHVYPLPSLRGGRTRPARGRRPLCPGAPAARPRALPPPTPRAFYGARARAASPATPFFFVNRTPSAPPTTHPHPAPAPPPARRLAAPSRARGPTPRIRGRPALLAECGAAACERGVSIRLPEGPSLGRQDPALHRAGPDPAAGQPPRSFGGKQARTPRAALFASPSSGAHGSRPPRLMPPAGLAGSHAHQGAGARRGPCIGRPAAHPPLPCLSSSRMTVFCSPCAPVAKGPRSGCVTGQGYKDTPPCPQKETRSMSHMPCENPHVRLPGTAHRTS